VAWLSVVLKLFPIHIDPVEVEFMAELRVDQDAQKGASEVEHGKSDGNVGLEKQLGHRDQDPLIKDADSDFPEPGLNPEHSGEPKKSA
jgi:hypothetical protein